MTLHLLREPLFWYSVAFVLFFVVFGRRITRPLGALLDARAVRIRQELDEAARLRREAEQLLAEARREQLATIAAAKDMVERSRQQAARIAEDAKREAEVAAARREQLAQDRVRSAERAALAEVRARAAEIATEAARAAIARLMTGEQDQPVIDRAIAALPAALSKRTAA